MADSNTKKGVSWHAPRSCWRARIKLDGKMINLGYFATDLEAAQAYDVAARANGRKQNFPGTELPDVIVRKVRPKLVELRQTSKLDEDLEKVDPQIWGHGTTEGIFWAQAEQKTAIDISSDVDVRDPNALAEFLGCTAEFDEHTGRYRTKAKRLTWMRGFLSGAKSVWNAPKRVEGDIRPASLPELMSELRAKASVVSVESSAGEPREFGIADIPEPSYSENCNPETLARDNAKIAKAHRERTGLFAMIDEYEAKKKAKLAEAELLLADIV